MKKTFNKYEVTGTCYTQEIVNNISIFQGKDNATIEEILNAFDIPFNNKIWWILFRTKLSINKKIELNQIIKNKRNYNISKQQIINDILDFINQQ